MVLSAIYSHDSSLRVVCSRSEGSQSAEVDVSWLSDEALPVRLWQLSLTKKSVVYPQVDTEREDTGPMTEEKLLVFARKALDSISREDRDSLEADIFLSDALTESKPFGDAELIVELKRSPQEVLLQIRNAKSIVATLELAFDEFTSTMPRAELTDRWTINIDISNR